MTRFLWRKWMKKNLTVTPFYFRFCMCVQIFIRIELTKRIFYLCLPFKWIEPKRKIFLFRDQFSWSLEPLCKIYGWNFFVRETFFVLCLSSLENWHFSIFTSDFFMNFKRIEDINHACQNKNKDSFKIIAALQIKI